MSEPPSAPAASGPGSRRAVGRAMLAGLLMAVVPLRAWDSDTMAAAAQRLGAAAEAALPPLQALLQALKAMDDAARLRAVNRFFNERIAFASDPAVWGQEDHWASPLETLAKGRGDCEDYAIAKYASLLAAGMAPAHLRLVYVRATLSPPGALPVAQAHMVLAYQARADTEPLILDNLRAEVLPASARPDLNPVFSFGSEGLWHGNGNSRAGDPLQRLSRWREVWAKMREEGFV